MDHTHIFLRFPEGREKALTFTFDDGTVEDKWLADILQELGMRGTFNINSALIPEEGTDFSKLDIDIYPVKDIQHRMTAEETKRALSRPHVEVASHGAIHVDPTMVTLPALVWDMIADRRALEEMFMYPVTGYAYPQGAYNDRVVEAAKSCGYEYARTANMCGSMDIPEDLMRWAPTCSFADPAVDGLADAFLDFKTSTGMYWHTTKARLFNIFGHTYEMNAVDGLKERFETLLRKLAGHDDVWYATNIEIARYIKAFRSLVFSVDCRSVYNPSCMKVWIYRHGGCVGVEPGETKGI